MKKMLVSYAVALAMLLTGSISVYADTIPWGYTATAPADISASTSPLSSITFSGASGVASGDSGIIAFDDGGDGWCRGRCEYFHMAPPPASWRQESLERGRAPNRRCL